jgi:hypothetical protein
MHARRPMRPTAADLKSLWLRTFEKVSAQIQTNRCAPQVAVKLISRAPFEADSAASVARRVKKWGRYHSCPGRRVSIARSRDEPRMRRRGWRPYWLPTRTAIADESPDKNSCTAFESAPSEIWPLPPASAAVLFRPTGSPADPLKGMSPRQTSSRGFLVEL